MPLTGHGLTLGQFCDDVGERFADLPAIVASDHSGQQPELVHMDYATMRLKVHALQWGLSDLGVSPGDRVAVLLSSFPEWLLYFFAVTRIGAAFLPLNPRFGTSELGYILQHSASSTLVGMGVYLNRDYGALIAELVGDWQPGEGSARLPTLNHIVGVRGASLPGAISNTKLLDRGRTLLAERGAPAPACDPQSIAILFYTSGTTAFPKGVPLTHANLLPHSIRCGRLLETRVGERVLTLYPFFGISGGANKVLSTFGCGGCLVFQDAFRAEEALDLLDDQQCTIVHGVDVQIRELVRLAERRNSPPPLDRRGTIAFMAGLDEHLARQMGAALGLKRFVHPYGMTETNPMVLRNELDDAFEASLRPGGRVAPGVEVRILDETGEREQPVESPGQIAVRGETVMANYLDDPQATAAAFRDGWFLTGDQGVQTEGGFIFYTGRLKDMLKIGGFNVAPQELEQFLRTHPAVEDVAVTGAPDPRLGEMAVAFVKLRRGCTADAATLHEFCRGAVANYKVPKAIYFVDQLPYHAAAHGAKLQRQVLRQWALQRAAVPHCQTQERALPGTRASGVARSGPVD